MQYALVALGLQRLITRAFALAVCFNIGANILFIPQYGIQAAAIATIFSEIVLFPALHVPGARQAAPAKRR